MAIHAHIEWLKEGVTRWNRRRKRIEFAPDLSGVNFFDLLPPDFRDDPKTSRTFERINLSEAKLNGANLSHLNFQRADFNGADLRGADMSLSNFDKAMFREANLANADTSKSSFVGAVFEKVNIDEMITEAADFTAASFISTAFHSESRMRLEEMGAQFFDTKELFRENKATVQAGAQRFQTIGDNLLVPSAKTPKYRYDVFFGTNRTPVMQRGAVVSFDSNSRQTLSYGLCEVIVPDGHRIGSLGSPLWKRLLNKKDDRLRIDSLIALDEELFFRHLTASAGKMKVEEKPAIFVHGFNNSFEDAVLRAAQIGYDLGIGQGVGLFSWPSKGRKHAYSADEAAAEASKYLLADFIEKFVIKSPTASVNVIAHSMGCRCLLGAMEVLSNDRKSILRRINQVILAAADVDTAIMPKLGVAATNYSTRTTSYVSGHDKALKLSGWLHKFPRVGFVPPTFVMSGMDTILVNDDDLGTLSHGYVGRSRVVLGDIFELLSENEDPGERFSVTDTRKGYWQIRS